MVRKIINYAKGEWKLCKEILASRLNLKNDFVGYEAHVKYINENSIYGLEGDILEIGAFMGGGSFKLANYINQFNKKLHVVDIFDTNFDDTINDRGERMFEIYNKILGKRNLYNEFKKNTHNCSNIILHKTDSKKLILDKNSKLCFSFIDGNHDADYVRSDFELAYQHTVHNGIISLHDYGGDLPRVTKEIESIISEYKNKISQIDIRSEECLVYMRIKND